MAKDEGDSGDNNEKKDPPRDRKILAKWGFFHVRAELAKDSVFGTTVIEQDQATMMEVFEWLSYKKDMDKVREIREKRNKNKKK